MSLQRPTRESVTASVDEADAFTAPLLVEPGARVSVSISGTFTATVTLQRRFDGENWRDVPDAEGNAGWSEATEQSYVADEGCELRLGVKTGDYSDGTAVCRLGKG